MNSDAGKILKAALELSAMDRAELAAQLIESLDDTIDEDADAAWRAEVERRVDDMDSGRGRSVPWSEVRRQIHGLKDDSAAA